ncbi:unnamed protein product [Rangifer tarandus platyrhynchus]|uniref:Uncharacterized protein n=1 Tax=Rangifer tarandus platyrhynchus TaxID=3082113 RepID=A0AC59Z626_RANTA
MMEKQETEPCLLATASSSWRKAVPVVRSHHPSPSQYHHRHPLHDKKKAKQPPFIKFQALCGELVICSISSLPGLPRSLKDPTASPSGVQSPSSERIHCSSVNKLD